MSVGIDNWDSIRKKAEAYFNSPAMDEKKAKIVDQVMLGRLVLRGDGSFAQNAKKVHTVEEAAIKFILTLTQEMRDHIGSQYSDGEFSELAYEVMEDIGYGDPYKIDDNLYSIDIYFETELNRKSLDQDRYPEGIDNIIALLNSGYNASHAVYGMWTNHRGDKSRDMAGEPSGIFSLPHRGGAHFLEQAKTDFLGNYGSEYNITDIVFAPEYNIRE